MKAYLSFMLLLLPFFIVSGHAEANTSIDISNNGEGSSTSINVHNSTGTNTINGKTVEDNNSSTSRTYIKVNDKVYVDDTQESSGNTETNITVEKHGDAEPTIIYNKTPKNSAESKAAVKKEVKAAKDEVLKDVEAIVKPMNNDVLGKATEIEKKNGLFARLESLFSKLRSIFKE